MSRLRSAFSKMTTRTSYSSEIIEQPSLFQERRSIIYRIIQTVMSGQGRNEEDIVISAMERKHDDLFVSNIWEGCLVLADFIVKNYELFDNCSILELGAGCTLPSIVVSKFSPSIVVCSDYPDDSITTHIHTLLQQNHCTNVYYEPYRWGECCDSLLLHLSHQEERKKEKNSKETEKNLDKRYDYIFCAELLWKDTYPYMRQLFQTIQNCLFPFTGKGYFCFAERFCQDFQKEEIDRLFLVAEKEYQIIFQLISSSDQYYDAIEHIPSMVYLYEFTYQSTDK